MLEFTVGLLIGLVLCLFCARVAYVYGRYRGQTEAKWAGYDAVVKLRKE